MIFSIIYLLKQPSILGSTIIHNHANYPLMFYTHPFFLYTSTTLLLKISVLSFREGAQKNLLTLGPSCVCEILWSFVIFSGWSPPQTTNCCGLAFWLLLLLLLWVWIWEWPSLAPIKNATTMRVISIFCFIHLMQTRLT